MNGLFDLLEFFGINQFVNAVFFRKTFDQSFLVLPDTTLQIGSHARV